MAEALCPTCGGPIELYPYPADDTRTLAGGRANLYQTLFRTTAADPARTQAMEAFIRDIEWLGHSFDAGQHYLHCLICRGIKGVTGHTSHCLIPKLLPPKEAP